MSAPSGYIRLAYRSAVSRQLTQPLVVESLTSPTLKARQECAHGNAAQLDRGVGAVAGAMAVVGPDASNIATPNARIAITHALAFIGSFRMRGTQTKNPAGAGFYRHKNIIFLSLEILSRRQNFLSRHTSMGHASLLISARSLDSSLNNNTCHSRTLGENLS
ncbi:hypothetical protein BGLA2_1080024 [Burkholderia gladioli]|nr:hypothetical protein BGLA2_1080024 [Burkholderia gladioli]